MKLFIYCFVSIIVLSGCSNVENTDPKKLEGDTLMYLSEFRLLVESYMKELPDTNRALSVEEAIRLVKIYNSIGSYELNENPYRLFDETFLLNFPKIVRILGCELSLGMGHYCPKYNLMIGGLQFPRNSYIIIRELKEKR